MKTISSNITVNSIGIRWLIILFVILTCSTLFAMGVVRQQCITKGYELSKLSEELEKRKLRIEQIDFERAGIINKSNLYSIAKKRGFVLMQEGRTYNVQ